ncbi:unnamed protein product [Paramecium pentaurelia]|uniref:Uncharacterized protein n=1 Tax=Paramecium pentaurelia TaxID=43138 RepID=A0A8S1UJX7_9CILI|nr:unnamed protein product [Paramecium pentaurelia]
MQTQSPNFKIKQMIPLSFNQKYLIEDEPDDEIFEQTKTTKIQFNDRMIVCSYKPWQNINQFQKTIQKLKAFNDIQWINPSFSERSNKPSRSILKNSFQSKLEFSYES